jgi:hypothetical protein
MSQLEVADNTAAADTERASSAYVPSLRRTEGQPPPIAANGGPSYMSFDREGDAGTAAALEDALTQIAEGEGRRVIDMIENAPPGPIQTRWGLRNRPFLAQRNQRNAGITFDAKSSRCACAQRGGSPGGSVHE